MKLSDSERIELHRFQVDYGLGGNAMDLINYVESLIDRKLAGIEVAARDAITDHVKHMLERLYYSG